MNTIFPVTFRIKNKLFPGHTINKKNEKKHGLGAEMRAIADSELEAYSFFKTHGHQLGLSREEMKHNHDALIIYQYYQQLSYSLDYPFSPIHWEVRLRLFFQSLFGTMKG